jgi:hypothetical protein
MNYMQNILNVAGASFACLLLTNTAAAQFPQQQPQPQPQQPAPVQQQPYPQQQYPQQQQPYPQQQQQPYGYPQQQYGYPPQQYPQPSYAPAPVSNKRSSSEIAVLYGMSAAYGVGMGVWFGAELGIEDPGLFLIAPAVLGVAAPVGVYASDSYSTMHRGMPAAIATGMFIGAGEGIGIASYQFVTADKDDAWGFRGLARSTAIGSTLGAVGGYALGYFQEPSPKSSLFMGSGVVWGSAIGSMFGYGASKGDVGYGLANDSASLGGLIGFNVGLAATGVLSTLYIPSYEAIEFMWLGAGIGAAVSLPVFLFYAGDGGPPAKRGLVFTGTATTLGIVAGALLAGPDSSRGSRESRRSFASINYVAPQPMQGGMGLNIGGTLE